MPIIQIIIVLCVIGFLLWLIEAYVPMDAAIKKIIQIVIIFAIVLWLLNVFGLLGGMGTLHLGR